jgi:hypothetical protein
MTANNIASLHSRITVPGNPVRWYVLGGLLLIAAIAIGTAVTVTNFRERALNSSGRELENTTLLLARHFDQQLDEFGIIQRELVAYMRSTGVASGEAYKRQMSGQGVHEIFKIMSNGLSEVAGVNIFDSSGMLINSSTWPLPVVND